MEHFGYPIKFQVSTIPWRHSNGDGIGLVRAHLELLFELKPL